MFKKKTFLVRFFPLIILYKINQKFEANLEMIALEFLENIANYSEIVVFHHTDADGITSGEILNKTLFRLKLPCPYQLIPNNLHIPWNVFLKERLQKIPSSAALIFVDLGPSGDVILDALEAFPNMHYYLLDHHFFQAPIKGTLPDIVYNGNPTLFGLNGLKEIIGSVVSYLFAVNIDERNKNLAWLPVIGMGGDVLDHYEEFKSYNRKVADEAIAQDLVELHKGLSMHGAQFEQLDKALALSILPFLPSLDGNNVEARKILDQLSIPYKSHLDDLSEDKVRSLANHFSMPKLSGSYISLPKRTGILRHPFEFAQLISIIGHDHPQKATELLQLRKTSKENKDAYLEHITQIVKNLTTFVHILKTTTENAIFVDLTDKMPIRMWSDTGSFASINKIYDINKMLFIGGQVDDTMKFSVRCTPQFIEKHNGNGVNVVIKKMCEQISGATGGGHGLAGGCRLLIEDFSKLPKIIDEIIENGL